ncbi:MAG: DUF3108 domain-containing protein [Blastocatellia bacterium]|nr:DUF3108 domain-containing protein [Blastocatellia bacterium]
MKLLRFHLGLVCFWLFVVGFAFVPAQERSASIATPAEKPAVTSTAPPPALKHPFPFQKGETLTYDFKFTRFPFFGLLGQIELSVVEPEAPPENVSIEFKSKERQTFQAKAESRGFFPSLLGLKVRDIFTTTVDGQDLGNLFGKREIEENKRKKKQLAVFDREKSVLTLTDTDLTQEKPVPTTRTVTSTPWTADLLSIWYVLRCIPLEENKKTPIVITEDGKTYTVEFVSQKSEKIKTDAGKFKARRIEIKAYEANFIRRKGEYYVWITEDARRFPVRVKFKTDAGTAVGELVKFSKGK